MWIRQEGKPHEITVKYQRRVGKNRYNYIVYEDVKKSQKLYTSFDLTNGLCDFSCFLK